MRLFLYSYKDEQFYKRVMSEMAKAMYLNYRNTIAMHYEIQQDTEYAMAAEPEIGGGDAGQC